MPRISRQEASEMARARLRMLRASRERLGAAGYDVSRGLRGLTGPG
ncbi:hypothetical protein [Nonomuraea mesophila]|nr:hypothetical protein [Nonomuraea mesophila]